MNDDLIKSLREVAAYDGSTDMSTLDWVQKCIPLMRQAADALEAREQDAERIDFVAELYQHCPHAVLTWNDDPDDETPVGYSLSIDGCQPVQYVAATLREVIDIAAIKESNTNAAVPSVALTKLSGDEKGESDRAQTTAATISDEPRVCEAHFSMRGDVKCNNGCGEFCIRIEPEKVNAQAREAKRLRDELVIAQAQIKNQAAQITGRHQYVGQDYEFRLKKITAERDELRRRLGGDADSGK